MQSVTNWIKTVGNKLFPTLVALPDALKPRHTVSTEHGYVSTITYSPSSQSRLPTSAKAILDGNIEVVVSTIRNWREHAHKEGFNIAVTISSNHIVIYHHTLSCDEIVAKEAVKRLMQNG